MTIEEYKDWYYELHEKYEETSFAMLQRGFKTTLKKLKKARLDNIKKDVEKLITYEDIFDVILSIYLVIGRAQADRMLKGIETNTINIKARNPLFGEAFAKAVLAFLETFGGDKIKSIREEFIGAVIDYIIEKNKAGDSFVRTVRELQNTFGEETGLYRWQMQRIVRTETMSASNFASWEAMKSERLIVDKVWIATNDHRTRDGESKKEYDHLAMEGITLPRETKFKVPNQDGSIDELMYPVDPNGAPGNTINCRCTIAPRPRRDKDGKLIFKPREAKAGFDPNQARQADGKWGSGGATNPFPNSKVKDKVYHGTYTDFDEFDVIGNENAWSAEYPEGAIFFTNLNDRAKIYGNKIKEVFLNITDPVIINLEAGSPESYIDNNYEPFARYFNEGKDGIIVNGWSPNRSDTGPISIKTTVYVVFYPDQIHTIRTNKK